MIWTRTAHEQRRAVRVRSKASARIHRGARVIRGRVVDLAVGGVCVRAARPVEPAGLLDRVVRVELKLDTGASSQLTLLGRVLRVNLPIDSIAIKLDAIPEGFQELVQDELRAAIVHDSLPRMILVDSSGQRRDTFASAFRVAGCHVTEAATPLEAIAHLVGCRFDVGLIAIADTVPKAIAEDLREFMRVEHPEAHMVSIGRSAAHREPAESWLCSATGRSDIQTRVGRVVTAHRSRRQATSSSWAA